MDKIAGKQALLIILYGLHAAATPFLVDAKEPGVLE
jgi:hypothetical protein